MKKVMLYALSVVTFLMINPAFLSANVEPNPIAIVEPNPEDAEKILMLNTRLVQINELDRSALTKSEKKDLKKEKREINKELKALGSGGVYLSVGALLIIVLLVILLV